MSELSGDDANALARTKYRFCDEWTMSHRASIVYFIAPLEGRLRGRGLLELIKLDMQLRWRSLQSVMVESYLDDWPELESDESMIELLRAECLARAEFSKMPRVAELAARFPRLHSQVDLGEVAEQAAQLRSADAFDRDGRFFVVRRLGAGGMGVVYEALDRERQTLVALKTLSRYDADSVYRLKREFRTLSQIVDPHLVQLYELIHDGEKFFFTMELLRGCDILRALRPDFDSARLDSTSFGSSRYETETPLPPPAAEDRSTRGEPSFPSLDSPRAGSRAGANPAGRSRDEPSRASDGLDDEEAGDSENTEGPASPNVSQPPNWDEASLQRVADAFSELARAVAALHTRGIIHRDLKPSNVMFTRDQRIVLLDFGLAAPLRRAEPAERDSRRGFLTDATTIAGTASYMAPEQAKGDALSQSADWYAVGAIMYHVLTGRRPYLGRPLDILNEKRRIDPPDPRSLNPTIPEDLSRICTDLMHRRSTRRPDATELTRRLSCAVLIPPPPSPFQASNGANAASAADSDLHPAIGSDWHAEMDWDEPTAEYELSRGDHATEDWDEPAGNDELSDSHQSAPGTPDTSLSPNDALPSPLDESDGVKSPADDGDWLQDAPDDEPFVGRERELRSLHRVYRELEIQPVQIVVIRGASGAGKSTVMRRFLQQVSSSPSDSRFDDVANEAEADVVLPPLVLQGRCYEHESVPFKAVDGVIDELTRWLSHLTPPERYALIPDGIGHLASLFPVTERANATSSLVASDDRSDKSFRDSQLDSSHASSFAPRRELPDDAPSPSTPAAGPISEPPESLGGESAIADTRRHDITLGLSSAPAFPATVPDAREQRRLAVQELGRLLGRIALQRRLVIAIDDLQWGDVDSALLLNDLILSAEAPRMLLALAFRAEYENVSACLQNLQCLSGGRTPSLSRLDLEIGPLSADETRQLALHWLPSDADDRDAHAAEVARGAEGNPLFTQELARHVLRYEPPGVSNGNPASERLDAALWARIESMSEDARRLLRTVALAGRPIAVGLAADAADVRDPHGALGALRAHRLIKGYGPRARDDVEAYHDRIRETVVARLTPDDSRALHRRLANALAADESPDLETTAFHFERAGESVLAADLLAQAAAAAAQSLAFRKAAELYERSLHLRPLEGEPRRRLQTALGHALANAGMGRRAAQVWEEAAAGAPDDVAAELERLAATHQCVSGHIDDGRALFNRVLMRRGLHWPGNGWRAIASLAWWRFRLWRRGFDIRPAIHRSGESFKARRRLDQIDTLWSVSISLSVVETLGIAALQSRGLWMALEAGEPYRAARALALETALTALQGTGNRAKAQQLADRTRELASEIHHPHAEGLVHFAAGMIAFFNASFPAAIEQFETAEAIFARRCTDVWWERATGRTIHAWSLFHMGEATRLAALHDEQLADAAERSDLYTETNLRAVISPFLALIADDTAAAGAHLDESIRNWPFHGYHTQHMSVLFSRVHLLLYQDDPKAAWELLRREWKSLRRSLQLRNQMLRVMFVELRARTAIALAARQTDSTMPERWSRSRLQRQAAQDVRRLDVERTGLADALAARTRGALAHLQGDRVAAVRHMRQAIDGFDRLKMKVYAATARRSLARLLTGDERQTMLRLADAAFRAEKIVNADAWERMSCAGFESRRSGDPS